MTRTFSDANGGTVYPLFYNGSNYLPVRAIGELMGKTVGWDGQTRTVTLSGGMDLNVTDADSFSGGSGQAGGGPLSAEDARARALAHAGLAAGEVVFTQTKLEWEDGRQVYDVEFRSGDGYEEYDYEIDAATGEVVSHGHKSAAPPAPAGTGTISREKAQELALAKIPGAAASHVKKLKLDWEDGRQVYEVEIVYNGAEYEIEIDAATGAVVKFERD